MLHYRLTMNAGYDTSITIKLSTHADHDRLLALAELDGRSTPPGDALLAEVDGALWAAIGRRDGTVVADPFRPTAEVVALLRTHLAEAG